MMQMADEIQNGGHTGGEFQMGYIALQRYLLEEDTIQNVTPNKEKMMLLLLLFLPITF